MLPSPQLSALLPAALVGLVVSGVFVALAIRNLDFTAASQVIKNATLFPWLPVAVGCYLAGHFVRGARCALLVVDHAALPLTTATHVVVLGYAANNVLPARLGEVVRAARLSDRAGIPLVHALSVTFIERVLDGLVMLGLFLVSSRWLAPEAPWVNVSLVAGLLLFGAAGVAVAAAASSPRTLREYGARVVGGVRPQWRDAALRLAAQITAGAAHLRRPRQALIALALTAAVWLTEAGLFLFLLPAFGLRADPMVALFAMSVTNLGILMPSSPGFIGPFHFFCAQALGAVGVDPATALSYATLLHLSFYIPVTLWGGAQAARYGMEVAAGVTLARAGTKASPVVDIEGVPAVRVATLGLMEKAPPPSAFLAALVGAVVRHRGANDAPTSDSANGSSSESADLRLARTVQFVRGQLEALPAPLRALLPVAFGVLNLYCRLRYFRGLTALSPPTRIHAVEGFAALPLAAPGKFVKLIRSLALLAWREEC